MQVHYTKILDVKVEHVDSKEPKRFGSIVSDTQEFEIAEGVTRPVFKVELTEAHKTDLGLDYVWIDIEQLASDSHAVPMLTSFAKNFHQSKSKKSPVPKLVKLLRTIKALMGSGEKSETVSEDKGQEKKQNEAGGQGGGQMLEETKEKPQESKPAEAK